MPWCCWLHEGDSPNPPRELTDRKTIEAIRNYVSGGGAVFLTGTTISLVNRLGIEPSALRTGPAGVDQGKAGLRPLIANHPAFQGLTFTGKSVPITDSGHPAFSDFHGTGGPTGGMLLARTGGSENALVEYQLGQGRIIVMGWRLPHYSNHTNAHRDNLLRLTNNILAYLGSRQAWQKVVPRKADPAAQLAGQPGRTATDADLASLRLAIEDLINTDTTPLPRRPGLPRPARPTRRHPGGRSGSTPSSPSSRKPCSPTRSSTSTNSC